MSIDDCIFFLRDAQNRLANEEECQCCGFRSTHRNPRYQCDIYVHYGKASKKKEVKIQTVNGRLAECLEAYAGYALSNYDTKRHYSMRLTDLDQGAWH